MYTTLIQVASGSHAADIARTGKKSFQNAFESVFKTKEEIFRCLWNIFNPEKIVKSICKENNVFLLALQEGKTVGFAKNKKNSLNENIESVDQMELQKIYVLPVFQCRGADSSLLKPLMNLATEIHPDFIWLAIVTSNDEAMQPTAVGPSNSNHHAASRLFLNLKIN